MLNVTRWPAVLVFALAGLSTVAFAFTTANLFTQAMANFAFIQEYGLVALQVGALVQLLQLGCWGAAALTAFLIFKVCEVELVFRYFHWAGRVTGGAEGRRKVRMRRDRDSAG